MKNIFSKSVTITAKNYGLALSDVTPQGNEIVYILIMLNLTNCCRVFQQLILIHRCIYYWVTWGCYKVIFVVVFTS